MPRRALRPCAQPGCPELIRLGNYCAAHTQQVQQARASRAQQMGEGRTQARVYDQARGSAAARGYDARWRRVRRMYLAAHPICADPEGTHAGRLKQAVEVHHKIPLRKGGTHADSNLQGLCKSCHSRITLREARSQGARVVVTLPKHQGGGVGQISGSLAKRPLSGGLKKGCTG